MSGRNKTTIIIVRGTKIMKSWPSEKVDNLLAKFYFVFLSFLCRYTATECLLSFKFVKVFIWIFFKCKYFFNG